MAKRQRAWAVGVLALLVLAASMAVCEFASAKVPDKPVATLAVMVLPQDAPGLVIENESQLPDTHPHAPYEMRFQAHGNISTPRWRVEKGALPEGMKLEEDGRLHGRADHAGEFQFTVSVIDGGRERGVQKGFVLRVTSALSLNWKAGAHVNGNRIEGSVQVSNTTPDDVDLTYYVLAVAPNGRATAIGYQHFVLKRGTTDMELPFGETLPHGGYLAHVDAVGEVAAKNVIYRESLDTPERLQVTVGP